MVGLDDMFDAPQVSSSLLSGFNSSWGKVNTTTTLPNEHIIDKKKLLWWEEHWLSRIFPYEQVTFIDPRMPHYDTGNESDLKKFISDTSQIIKELYCVVLYTVKNKTDSCILSETFIEQPNIEITILDVLIPCLLSVLTSINSKLSFLSDKPDLKSSKVTFNTHDLLLDEYCEELEDLIGVNLHNPVNFWKLRHKTRSKSSNVIIVSQFNWKYLSEKYTIEYPTRDNPELISTIKKRLRLLEFIKSITCKDALSKLQKDTTDCICNSGFDFHYYLFGVTTKNTHETNHYTGTVPLRRDVIAKSGIMTIPKCTTLLECISKCTKTLYLFMIREKSFCNDLFKESARKEDITGLFWLTLSTFCTPILQNEVPTLEALFTFFKLQIYSWTEAELLQTVLFNFADCNRNEIPQLDYSSLCGNLGKNHLIVSNLSMFEYFHNRLHPKIVTGATSGNIHGINTDVLKFHLENYYYRHSSKTPLSNGRQYPERLFTTLVKEYHTLESCTTSMFAQEYPGMIYNDYTKLPVYFACLTMNFMTRKMREFRRNVISPSLDYSIIEQYSQQQQPQQQNEMRQRGVEITNSLLTNVRAKIETETRDRMDRVHPDFYENIFKAIFDNNPTNYERSKLQSSHSNEKRTSNSTLVGGLRVNNPNNSLLGNSNVKFGISTRPIRHQSSRNMSGIGGETVTRDVTYEDIANSPQIKELLEFKNKTVSRDDIIANFHERERTRNLLHGVDPFSSDYQTYYQKFEQLTREDIRLLLSPCIKHLMRTIQIENTHPTYDERFFIIAYFMDLGLHPIQIAEIFGSLLTDLDECTMATEEFLSSSTNYGAPFINVIKTLVKFRLSSASVTTMSDGDDNRVNYTSFEEWRQHNGNYDNDPDEDEEYYHLIRDVKTIPPTVGLNCCKIIGKGLCPIKIINKPQQQQHQRPSSFNFSSKSENHIHDIEEIDTFLLNSQSDTQTCSCKVSSMQHSHSSIKLKCAHIAKRVNLENLEKLHASSDTPNAENSNEMEDVHVVNIPFSNIIPDEDDESRNPQVVIHNRDTIKRIHTHYGNQSLRLIHHPIMYVNKAQEGLM